jgi:1-acyl-sn-glycerol-3-phosphate acyltransferase
MPRFTRAEARLLPALTRYFRAELTGETGAIPNWGRQPCLFIMNHTAILGLEVYVLHATLRQLRPEAPRIRTTVWAPFLDVPLLGRWYRAGGCLPMSVDSVVRCLRAGESVLVLPEGPDATDVRDEVGPFHAGVLRAVAALAPETSVPVVPLGWAGVDEANPWWVSTHPLLVRLLMKPLMPRFDFALIPRLPLLRPSKIVLVAGRPRTYQPSDLATEAALRAEVESAREAVIELVRQARITRRRRIDADPIERAIHRAGDLYDVRWPRRHRVET